MPTETERLTLGLLACILRRMQDAAVVSAAQYKREALVLTQVDSIVGADTRSPAPRRPEHG